MSGYVPGALVICKGGTPNPAHREYAGTIRQLREVVDTFRGQPCWSLDPPTMADRVELWWLKEFLILLKNPGDDERDEADILVNQTIHEA